MVRGVNDVLPPVVMDRALEGLRLLKEPLAQFLFLLSWRAQHEPQFLQFCRANISICLPLLYTPTIGAVAQNYSQLFLAWPLALRGLIIPYGDRSAIEALLAPYEDNSVDVVLITDGERVLGLGDQGIGGMAIASGKLLLYTLFANIPSHRTLPICLDLGTNNQSLQQSTSYGGDRSLRQGDEKYYSFIEQLIQVLLERFPKALLHWEDFATQHAESLLARYQHRLCSFNDDIQGTAAVVLATVLSALPLLNRSLNELRIVFWGAGSSALGIANLWVNSCEQCGATEEEALAQIFFLNRGGLLREGCSHRSEQKRFLVSEKRLASLGFAANYDLLEVIHRVKPDLLIGVSGAANSFSKDVISAMASYVNHPLIFPLSNPHSCAEATPESILAWSEGRAIVATGSPFPAVNRFDNMAISQCNNAYIFPALGLAAAAAGLPLISPPLLIAAAEELSRHSPCAHRRDWNEGLLPPLEALVDLTPQIAVAILVKAVEEGLLHPPAGESPLIFSQRTLHQFLQKIKVDDLSGRCV